MPGEVKTRLIPLLGAQAAADLYRQLLEHAVATACRSTFSTIELWCTPNPDHPVFEKLRKTYSVSLYPQLGTDLGVRMHTALWEALSRSFFAAVIGTDSPSLTIDDVNEAYRALRSGYDAVLGPAEDGGYVLIGVHQVCESLFAGIIWGGDAVARETRARLQALNWRWHELPPRWDVDLPKDVERLYSSLGNLSPWRAPFWTICRNISPIRPIHRADSIVSTGSFPALFEIRQDRHWRRQGPSPVKGQRPARSLPAE